MGAGEVFICRRHREHEPGADGRLQPAVQPDAAAKNPGAYMGMGETAENVARKWQITRDQQEEFAVASHQKASAAQAAGKFDDEIVPIQARAAWWTRTAASAPAPRRRRWPG